MAEIWRIARKELWSFFASPVAYIFLGTYLAVSLFVFFWVETFFARNIADTRPLFDWMPVLLIFLVAALTMRLWSEERRSGTLELLLTLPLSSLQLVLGKFIASLALVALAVAMTLPLPLTVSLLGSLDWGPVFGAYLATLLLAAAYIAIGLFVSARTDNAIVSLIGTALICGLFYLLGSQSLTHLLGYQGGELFKLLGTGSRFESITRGVIDLRDLYYYLSIVGVFLSLNVLSLEQLRWAQDGANPGAHRAWRWVIGLLVANFLAGNLWLQRISWARVDLTEGQAYSISAATRDYLAQLREPLLIRGYFSAHTHPLLAPLVPQIRDLLKEYEVAGSGRVRVEFVDPLEHPELEKEAGEKYGIRPVSFQTASKYQAGVMSSYFDVVIQYGDQFEKLGYRDLIDIKAKGETDLDVRLRNPEYDLTRAIKKALYGYQSSGDLFQTLHRPVSLRAFVSAPERLPEPLPALRQDLVGLMGDLSKQSGGKLTTTLKDPDRDPALAKEIASRYGFQPLALDLLSPDSFYFYLVMEAEGQVVPVPLPEALDKGGLKRALEAGLKRFSSGFLKTLALYTPPGQTQMPGFAMGGPQFDLLREKLGTDFSVRGTDLRAGRVPDEADLLLVVGPQALDAKQQFAIDQFLMQGGTLIVAASPFSVDLGARAIGAQPKPTGLEAWFDFQGVKLANSMVLDPQNTPFPIPVERRIGGFAVQEIVSLAYPYFPDIREDGMDRTSGLTAGLGQITLNWASPVELDADKNRERRVVKLLSSSSNSWTSTSSDIQPNFEHGDLGFPMGAERGRHLLAVAVEGRFDSFFKGKPSPLIKSADASGKDQEPDAPAKPGKGTTQSAPTSVIETSPPTARLILIGSSSFLTDQALDLAAGATQTRYLKPVQLVENAIDWSLEDRGLLALRGRSQFSRMLEPLDQSAELFWEYLNYGLAILGLVGLYLLQRRMKAQRMLHYRHVLAVGEA